MKCPITRRQFFTAAGGAGLVAAGAGIGSGLLPYKAGTQDTEGERARNAAAEPFYGQHQSGIVSSQQSHSYFVTFDVASDKRSDVVAMLKAWTDAAARMTAGKSAGELTDYSGKPSSDSDEMLGLRPARLTMTFGFGAGLFTKGGKDRFGLASQRPEAFVDLPKFNGDQLEEARTGGDISVQACADDPQVAFHAMRQLVRLAGETATMRWAQSGFMSAPISGTPRNLQGFKDGTQNPNSNEMDKVVWVDGASPSWMQGGTYLVARRIRMALEHWDNTEVEFQEQVIGRHKVSGAPLGMKDEYDPLDLDATDKDGNYIIPENAHVRLGAAALNAGVQILRRGYSYNDGVNFVAERWPPWRQGMEYDAGLFFMCYQRDPRTGFIRMFNKMSKLDALNQFVTHTGGGMFACPGGIAPGEYVGQRLFSA